MGSFVDKQKAFVDKQVEAVASLREGNERRLIYFYGTEWQKKTEDWVMGIYGTEWQKEMEHLKKCAEEVKLYIKYFSEGSELFKKKRAEFKERHAKKTRKHSKKTREHSQKTGEHSQKTGEHSQKTGEHSQKTGEHSQKKGERRPYTYSSTKTYNFNYLDGFPEDVLRAISLSSKEIQKIHENMKNRPRHRERWDVIEEVILERKKEVADVPNMFKEIHNILKTFSPNKRASYNIVGTILFPKIDTDKEIKKLEEKIKKSAENEKNLWKKLKEKRENSDLSGQIDVLNKDIANTNMTTKKLGAKKRGIRQYNEKLEELLQTFNNLEEVEGEEMITLAKKYWCNVLSSIAEGLRCFFSTLFNQQEGRRFGEIIEKKIKDLEDIQILLAELCEKFDLDNVIFKLEIAPCDVVLNHFDIKIEENISENEEEYVKTSQKEVKSQESNPNQQKVAEEEEEAMKKQEEENNKSLNCIAEIFKILNEILLNSDHTIGEKTITSRNPIYGENLFPNIPSNRINDLKRQMESLKNKSDSKHSQEQREKLKEKEEELKELEEYNKKLNELWEILEMLWETVRKENWNGFLNLLKKDKLNVLLTIVEGQLRYFSKLNESCRSLGIGENNVIEEMSKMYAEILEEMKNLLIEEFQKLGLSIETLKLEIAPLKVIQANFGVKTEKEIPKDEEGRNQFFEKEIEAFAEKIREMLIEENTDKLKKSLIGLIGELGRKFYDDGGNFIKIGLSSKITEWDDLKKCLDFNFLTIEGRKTSEKTANYTPGEILKEFAKFYAYESEERCQELGLQDGNEDSEKQKNFEEKFYFVAVHLAFAVYNCHYSFYNSKQSNELTVRNWALGADFLIQSIAGLWAKLTAVNGQKSRNLENICQPWMGKHFNELVSIFKDEKDQEILQLVSSVKDAVALKCYTLAMIRLLHLLHRKFQWKIPAAIGRAENSMCRLLLWENDLERSGAILLQLDFLFRNIQSLLCQTASNPNKNITSTSLSLLWEWMGYVRLSYVLPYGIGNNWNNKPLFFGGWNIERTRLEDENSSKTYNRFYFALGDGEIMKERERTMEKQGEEYEKIKFEMEQAPEIDMENLVNLFTNGIFPFEELNKVGSILQYLFRFLEKISTGKLSPGVCLGNTSLLKFSDEGIRWMDIFSNIPQKVNEIIAGENANNLKNLCALLGEIRIEMADHYANFYETLKDFLDYLNIIKEKFDEKKKTNHEGLTLKTVNAEIAWIKVLQLHWGKIEEYLRYLVTLIEKYSAAKNAENESAKIEGEKAYCQSLSDIGKFLKDYSQSNLAKDLGLSQEQIPENLFGEIEKLPEKMQQRREEEATKLAQEKNPPFNQNQVNQTPNSQFNQTQVYPNPSSQFNQTPQVDPNQYYNELFQRIVNVCKTISSEISFGGKTINIIGENLFPNIPQERMNKLKKQIESLKNKNDSESSQEQREKLKEKEEELKELEEYNKNLDELWKNLEILKQVLNAKMKVNLLELFKKDKLNVLLTIMEGQLRYFFKLNESCHSLGIEENSEIEEMSLSLEASSDIKDMSFSLEASSDIKNVSLIKENTKIKEMSKKKIENLEESLISLFNLFQKLNLSIETLKFEIAPLKVIQANFGVKTEKKIPEDEAERKQFFDKEIENFAKKIRKKFPDRQEDKDTLKESLIGLIGELGRHFYDDGGNSIELPSDVKQWNNLKKCLDFNFLTLEGRKTSEKTANYTPGKILREFAKFYAYESEERCQELGLQAGNGYLDKQKDFEEKFYFVAVHLIPAIYNCHYSAIANIRNRALGAEFLIRAIAGLWAKLTAVNGQPPRTLGNICQPWMGKHFEEWVSILPEKAKDPEIRQPLQELKEAVNLKCYTLAMGRLLHLLHRKFQLELHSILQSKFLATISRAESTLCHLLLWENDFERSGAILFQLNFLFKEIQTLLCNEASHSEKTIPTSLSMLLEWMGYVRLSYTLPYGIGEGWNNKLLFSRVLWNYAYAYKRLEDGNFLDTYGKFYKALGDGKILKEREWTMKKQGEKYEKIKFEMKQAPEINMENLVELFTDEIFSFERLREAKPVLQYLFGFLEKISTGKLSPGVCLGNTSLLKFTDEGMRWMEIFSNIPQKINEIVAHKNTDSLNNLHVLLREIKTEMADHDANFYETLKAFLGYLNSRKETFEERNKTSFEKLEQKTVEEEIAWIKYLELHWEKIEKYLEHLIALIEKCSAAKNAENEDYIVQYRKLLFSDPLGLTNDYFQSKTVKILGFSQKEEEEEELKEKRKQEQAEKEKRKQEQAEKEKRLNEFIKNIAINFKEILGEFSFGGRTINIIGENLFPNIPSNRIDDLKGQIESLKNKSDSKHSQEQREKLKEKEEELKELEEYNKNLDELWKNLEILKQVLNAKMKVNLLELFKKDKLNVLLTIMEGQLRYFSKLNESCRSLGIGENNVIEEMSKMCAKKLEKIKKTFIEIFKQLGLSIETLKFEIAPLKVIQANFGVKTEKEIPKDEEGRNQFFDKEIEAFAEKIREKLIEENTDKLKKSLIELIGELGRHFYDDGGNSIGLPSDVKQWNNLKKCLDFNFLTLEGRKTSEKTANYTPGKILREFAKFYAYESEERCQELGLQAGNGYLDKQKDFEEKFYFVAVHLIPAIYNCHYSAIANIRNRALGAEFLIRAIAGLWAKLTAVNGQPPRTLGNICQPWMGKHFNGLVSAFENGNNPEMQQPLQELKETVNLKCYTLAMIRLLHLLHRKFQWKISSAIGKAERTLCNLLLWENDFERSGEILWQLNFLFKEIQTLLCNEASHSEKTIPTSLSMLLEWMGYVRLSYTLPYGIGEDWNDANLFSGVWNHAYTRLENTEFLETYGKFYQALGNGEIIGERERTMKKQGEEYEKIKSEIKQAPEINMENLVELFTDEIFSFERLREAKPVLQYLFGFLEKISTGKLSPGVCLGNTSLLKFTDEGMRWMEIFSNIPQKINEIVAHKNTDSLNNLHVLLREIKTEMADHSVNFHRTLEAFLGYLDIIKNKFDAKNMTSFKKLELKTVEEEIAWIKYLELHWEKIEKYLEHLIALTDLRLKIANAKNQSLKEDYIVQYRKLLFSDPLGLMESYFQSKTVKILGFSQEQIPENSQTEVDELAKKEQQEQEQMQKTEKLTKKEHFADIYEKLYSILKNLLIKSQKKFIYGENLFPKIPQEKIGKVDKLKNYNAELDKLWKIFKALQDVSNEHNRNNLLEFLKNNKYNVLLTIVDGAWRYFSKLNESCRSLRIVENNEIENMSKIYAEILEEMKNLLIEKFKKLNLTAVRKFKIAPLKAIQANFGVKTKKEIPEDEAGRVQFFDEEIEDFAEKIRKKLIEEDTDTLKKSLIGLIGELGRYFYDDGGNSIGLPSDVKQWNNLKKCLDFNFLTLDEKKPSLGRPVNYTPGGILREFAKFYAYESEDRWQELGLQGDDDALDLEKQKDFEEKFYFVAVHLTPAIYNCYRFFTGSKQSDELIVRNWALGADFLIRAIAGLWAKLTAVNGQPRNLENICQPWMGKHFNGLVSAFENGNNPEMQQPLQELKETVNSKCYTLAMIRLLHLLRRKFQLELQSKVLLANFKKSLLTAIDSAEVSLCNLLLWENNLERSGAILQELGFLFEKIQPLLCSAASNPEKTIPTSLSLLWEWMGYVKLSYTLLHGIGEGWNNKVLFSGALWNYAYAYKRLEDGKFLEKYKDFYKALGDGGIIGERERTMKKQEINYQNRRKKMANAPGISINKLTNFFTDKIFSSQEKNEAKGILENIFGFLGKISTKVYLDKTLLLKFTDSGMHWMEIFSTIPQKVNAIISNKNTNNLNELVEFFEKIKTEMDRFNFNFYRTLISFLQALTTTKKSFERKSTTNYEGLTLKAVEEEIARGENLKSLWEDIEKYLEYFVKLIKLYLKIIDEKNELKKDDLIIQYRKVLFINFFDFVKNYFLTTDIVNAIEIIFTDNSTRKDLIEEIENENPEVCNKKNLIEYVNKIEGLEVNSKEDNDGKLTEKQKEVADTIKEALNKGKSLEPASNAHENLKIQQSLLRGRSEYQSDKTTGNILIYLRNDFNDMK